MGVIFLFVLAQDPNDDGGGSVRVKFGGPDGPKKYNVNGVRRDSRGEKS